MDQDLSEGDPGSKTACPLGLVWSWGGKRTPSGGWVEIFPQIDGRMKQACINLQGMGFQMKVFDFFP